MESSVFWGTGFAANRPGVLKFESGTLSLYGADGHGVFRIGAPAAGLLEWPWYGMNASFKLRVAGQKYAVTFMRAGARGREYQEALERGAQWKRALEGGAPPAEGQRRWIGGVRIFVLWSRILLALMAALMGLALLGEEGAGIPPVAIGGVMVVAGLARAWVRYKECRQRVGSNPT